MKYYWMVCAVCAYALLLLAPVRSVLHIPPTLDIFESDASQYNAGALHLMHDQFYSLDGKAPYYEREPGQSVLLVIAYTLFGEENPIGVFIIHSLLLIIASYFLCVHIERLSTKRAAIFTFVLLLVSGSSLQATFSANRELLAMVLLMIFTTMYLKNSRSLQDSLLMGITLGALLLTYYPFFFLLIPISILWIVDHRPIYLLSVCLVSCLAIVGLWCARNEYQVGTFTLVEGRRAAITLYARGEQAERLRGLEPLRCLWSEYISRDWTGRSDACSIVGLWHRRWPEGMESATDISAIKKNATEKILAHPFAHLWISLFDAIELHFPFVGGGWSNAFNRYATFMHVILFSGVVLGARFFIDRRYSICIVILSYTILVFSLTDGIPRYLSTVIFCYCACAGIGFDRFIRSLQAQKTAK